MTWEKLKETFLLDMSPTQQRSLLILLAVLAFTFHVAWACGFVPGVDGFAREHYVQQVADQIARAAAEGAKEDALQYIAQVEGSIKNLHTEILEERIQNLQLERCRADNEQLREQYAARVNRNMSKYRVLNGYYYNITACQDM